MTSWEISEIKDKLSETYVQSVANKLNYIFQASNRHLDNAGIDCQIHRKGVGTGSILNIQIKGVSTSSSSMFRDFSDYISYNLDNSYDYVPYPAYLFLVVFPPDDEIDTWCNISTEDLTLRKCAYFIQLPQNTGFIRIPKANQLTDLTLPSLFISSGEKEEKL